jgi:two-component system chemotaxis response regulator CheB
MSDKIRVLIVDDSAYSRQTIKKMFAADSDIEVVGIASNGIEAITNTLKLNPDVITLDVEMPEMDGFSFLRWLIKERPTPVIMVSSYSDSKTVFKALELGAVDFIVKPSNKASIDLHGIQESLLEKIKGTRDIRMEKLRICRNIINRTPKYIERDRGPGPEESSNNIDVVTIGASTGGPAALQIILPRLPSDLPAAILVSQHMPKGFTEPFAERLNRLSRIRVKEASDGDILEAGKAFVCPGGLHMAVKAVNNSVRIALKDSKSTDKYIPSVDVMMTSAAKLFGPTAMGVILTGMGNDGKQGIVEIKEKGGYTIAEAESTAVIFGMPNEAIKTGSVDRILSIDEIPEEITKAVMNKPDKTWKKTRA